MLSLHGIMGQVHIPKVDASLFYLHQLCLQLLCSIRSIKIIIAWWQTPDARAAVFWLAFCSFVQMVRPLIRARPSELFLLLSIKCPPSVTYTDFKRKGKTSSTRHHQSRCRGSIRIRIIATRQEKSDRAPQCVMFLHRKFPHHAT